MSRLSAVVSAMLRLTQSLPEAGSTFVGLFRARLALLAAEFQFERIRFIRALVLSILGAALLGAGVLALTTVIVFSVEEANRVLTLWIATAALFCAGASLIGVGLHFGCGGRDPFRASIRALKTDRKLLASLFKK